MRRSSESAEWVEREAEAAMREAGRDRRPRGGTRVGISARRPLIEAGEGVAEGLELAEEELIPAAEHTDGEFDPLADAFTPDVDRGRHVGEYGETNDEDSYERPGSDR